MSATKKSRDGSRSESQSKQGTNATQSPDDEDEVVADSHDTQSGNKCKKQGHAETDTKLMGKLVGVETVKVAAIKKFQTWKKISEKNVEKPVRSLIRVQKVWDESLAHMEISKKRASVIDREIGIRHVRIQLPTPRIKEMVVRRRKSNKHMKCVTVLKQANPCTDMQLISFKGPRCNNQGEIIPHSILGSVKTFTNEARQRGHFESDKILKKDDMMGKTVNKRAFPQEILEGVIPYRDWFTIPLIKSPRNPWNPLLNEDNALKNWDREMDVRQMEQKRLACILQRPERELLMCKSDQFVKKQELRGYINIAEENNGPAKSFWRTVESQGTRDIFSTVTRTERGLPQSPLLSGDADSVLQQKGKTRDKDSCNWFQSEYLHDRSEANGGIIQIANNVLFEKLELFGEPVYPVPHRTSIASLPVSADNQPCDLHLRGDNLSCDLTCDQSHCSSITKSSWRTGPSLTVDGAVFHWNSNKITKGDCFQKNTVIKETFILIEAAVGEVAKGHVKMENTGSTVINYFWHKVPNHSRLPVARPKRFPFYFRSEEGVCLPGETTLVPILFRSRIQGYFTESWLMTTVPILEGGGEIKFTFKGVVRLNKDYSKQCQEIEEYLRVKQVLTMCELEAKLVVDQAILQASTAHGTLREEAVCPSVEELFLLANSGLYYHPRTVTKLKILYESVAMETNSSTSDTKNFKNVDTDVLAVSNLRRMILDLKCDDDDEDNCMAFTRKESLLWKLNMDVNVLSFSPILSWQPNFHQRHIIIYSLLQVGVDSTVTKAQNLAVQLGLMVHDGDENNKEKESKRKGTGKSKVKSEKVTKHKHGKESSPIGAATPDQQSPASPEQRSEVLVFSAAATYRHLNMDSSDRTRLALYDEKVFLQVYSMLEDVVETMFTLFDN